MEVTRGGDTAPQRQPAHLGAVCGGAHHPLHPRQMVVADTVLAQPRHQLVAAVQEGVRCQRVYRAGEEGPGRQIASPSRSPRPPQTRMQAGHKA
jgi:hypothetical protein